MTYNLVECNLVLSLCCHNSVTSKLNIMKKLSIAERAMFKNAQNDNVFLPNEVIRMSDLKMPNGSNVIPRKGYECGIISNGKLVNVVSTSYGHLPNEQFFLKVEEKLEAADIRYTTRSINREDSAFAVDYILSDESFHVKVKKGLDLIKPMMRFATSYIGGKAIGYFGFWREVCSNTMHVSTVEIGFQLRHNKNIIEVVMPNIDELFTKFMDNEFYSIHKIFEVMAETPIENINDFVKMTATDLNIFKFEKSEKNPEPSLPSELVMEIIGREARTLGVRPNLWLGYNAFNEVIANHQSRTFEKTRSMDQELFSYVSSMVTQS